MTPDSALLGTPATGVYLATGNFEAVVQGISTALTRLAGEDVSHSVRTPPVIARSVIERAGYHESFPHLLGRVFTGSGTGVPAESDLVLLPAGCYCVYPAYEGTCLAQPTELSVEATCFRQEASAETGRLRSFRMREFVRLGGAGGCLAWRDGRLAGARAWLAGLGLTTEAVVATDPFFGRGGRLVRMLQAEEELKVELLAPVGPGTEQAIASGNYHKDQFGRLFSISGPDGGAAHTACLAFGYERLALALLHQHGKKVSEWPDQVRAALSLEALA